MPRGTAAIVLVVFCTCPAVIRPSCSATTRMTHGTAKKSSASDIFLRASSQVWGGKNMRAPRHWPAFRLSTEGQGGKKSHAGGPGIPLVFTAAPLHPAAGP